MPLPEVDRGPIRPRLTVALTFDGDAISDAVRRGDPPVKLSHGEFGTAGRASRGSSTLLAREAIPATWFMPGHTLETFPDDDRSRRSRRGGHELACHGWYHEDFSAIPATRQRRDPRRGFEAVREA